MNLKYFLIFFSIIAIILIAGCTDIEDSARARSFDQAQQEDSEAFYDEKAEEKLAEDVVTQQFNCDSSWGIIIEDFNKNLCWRKKVTNDLYPWSESGSVCYEMTEGGLKWESPTKEEWESLINYLKNKGVNEGMGSYLNNNYGFIGFEDEYYWTGTYYGMQGSSFVSWFVDLNRGTLSTWNMDFGLRVACVARNE